MTNTLKTRKNYLYQHRIESSGYYSKSTLIKWWHWPFRNKQNGLRQFQISQVHRSVKFLLLDMFDPLLLLCSRNDCLHTVTTTDKCCFISTMKIPVPAFHMSMPRMMNYVIDDPSTNSPSAMSPLESSSTRLSVTLSFSNKNILSSQPSPCIVMILYEAGIATALRNLNSIRGHSKPGGTLKDQVSRYDQSQTSWEYVWRQCKDCWNG